MADIDLSSTPSSDSGLETLLLRLRHDLGNELHPAWLVDAEAARLIPVNGAGAALFGIRDELCSDGIALDTAQPALAKLRRFSAKRLKTKNKKKAKRSQNRTLLFWTPRGALALRCQITAYRVKGRVICFIKTRARRTADTAGVGTTEPMSPDSGAVTPTASHPPRDDAAILREIARRIRAGTDGQPVLDHNPGELPEPPITHPLPSPTDFETTQRAKLAHELRTPISAIVAASEVIRDERLGSLDNFHYRDYARDIHQSARHALALIEQGLANAEKSIEPPPLHIETVDLNTIVAHCVSTIRHLAESQNLAVKFVEAKRQPQLRVDRTTVAQIVLNLLTNAVKFTGAGGRIEAQIFADLGEDIRVEVRDTGSGMSKAEIARHMTAMTNVTPKPRQGGGFGIGLALSQQLASANGATLEFNSKRGVGTTAALIFPLRRLVAV
ncbi:MAG: HAMP domain-containing histidine kinase [Alphaproteobacteria bacterium]|nr:HAMP domain-containing histidine kinase [Alphaproteobacteria bacterium]